MFRNFQKKDLPACLKLVNMTFDREHAAVLKADLLAEAHPQSKKKEYTFFKRKVLTSRGKVIALVCLYRLGTYPDNILGIDWLATHPNHQSKGIGTKHVKWSIEQAKKYKKDTVFAWSVRNAVPFYEKLGFKKSNILPKEEDRRAVLLVKKIS